MSFSACCTWRTCGSAWADAWDDMPDCEPLVPAALLVDAWLPEALLVDAWLALLEADLFVEAWLALEADLFVAAWLAVLDAWLLEAIEAWLDEEPCACLSVE